VIVLWLLKVLILILVGVLAIMLFFALLALFSPIWYRLNAGYDGKKAILLRAAWLFRIFTVVYDTNAAPAFKFKICGRAGKRKRRRPDAEPDSDNESENKKREQIKEENDGAETKEDEADEKLSIVDKAREFKENLDKVLEYPYKKRLIQQTLLLLKRVFKAILPNDADGEFRFGFDDPGLTGMLLGAAYAVRETTGLYERVRVSADFEKNYFYIKCRMEGKTRLWSLLWPFLAYAVRKPVWIIIKPLIFKKRAKG
jgi:hypothetical protein